MAYVRPRWRLVGERWEIILAPWGARVEGADRVPRERAWAAVEALLAERQASGLHTGPLEACARYVRAQHGVESLRDAVAQSLVSVWRARLRYTAAQRAELEEDALERVPLASDLIPKTWIEIELTDMEGNPRPGARYWIKLTDGSVREGALDRYGRAYFGDLDPGECEVRWPDLDEEAEVSVRSLAGQQVPTLPERTWVELELLDMEGHGVVGERYWVKLSDGTVRTGETDAQGRALLTNVPAGVCEVKWPARSDDALQVIAS